MICPHCKADIKLKERTGSKCSKCSKVFAFEPKIHPLGISDLYFQKVVAKLQGKENLKYTAQQLQSALEKKSLKAKFGVTALLVVTIVGTVIASFFLIWAGVVVLVTGLLITAAVKFLKAPVITPKLTPQKFEEKVLNRWFEIYSSQPEGLIGGKTRTPEKDSSSRAILVCESADTASFLIENKILAARQIAIAKSAAEMAAMQAAAGRVPVLVLHDASPAGYDFVGHIRQTVPPDVGFYDIGLRPQTAMKVVKTPYRTAGQPRNYSGLTPEENAWLSEGHFVVLSSLLPEKLAAYVRGQVDSRLSKTANTNPEEIAKSIGFMTWAADR